MALFVKMRPIIGDLRSLPTYRTAQGLTIRDRTMLNTSLLSNQIRLNYEIAEAKILPQSIMNEVRSPALRTLDRSISSLEEKNQGNERVGEKDFIKIFDLYSRVIQGLGSDVNKIEPDVASNITLYTNILLRCCGKLMLDTPPKRRELLAGNLWLFVKERSIPIDISHYNSLIRVMNENETAYEPKKILEEISAYGFKPDRITYQRLIHQYCLQGDISGATNLLEKMKDLSMDLSEQIFASLIIGYSKQPNCPTIKELFDLMHSNGVEPNSSSYCAAFTTLASKLDKDPNASEQLEELCKMYEKDEIRLAVNDLSDVTISLDPFRSKYEFVDKFLASISDSLPESKTYHLSSISLTGVNEIERVPKLSKNIKEGALLAGNTGIYWEVVDKEINTPVITGAILPFTQLNFLQQLVFPYTYATMYYLDYMTTIMPWWSAIIVTTATARLLFFPLVVRQNIIGIKANNVLPETQKIQKQMNDAMCTGDSYGQALAKTKLQLLFKEHGITMKDRLLPIFLQAPLYMSFFFLLRNLTSIPVEGLTTGGLFWFTDLTQPDPYYILPLLTSTSMFILLEYGLEGGANPSLMTPIMRYIMRIIPVGVFAITYSFPAATLLFWSTSNLFTLSYALIMKTPTFKKMFNVPPRRKIQPSELPLSNMSFKGQLQAAKDKSQARKTSMDVRRLDDIAFRKAGVGPLRKTYKEPPKTMGE